LKRSANGAGGGVRAHSRSLDQLKVTSTVVLAVRLLIVHTLALVSGGQLGLQPPNVPEVAVAVSVIGPADGEKGTLQFCAQINGDGTTDTVPVPLPKKVMVKITLFAPPVKQTTLAVMLPVTMAPEELRPLGSLLVWSVAETTELPQALPVAVSNPVELRVKI